MQKTFKKNKAESGSAVVEFAFCCLLLMPLLLGLIAIGFALIREMQVVQVCRDSGHMYAKGVDFSTNSPSNRAAIISIGTGLRLIDSDTSPGTIILTTITLVTPDDCATLPSPGDCANLGNAVITNQITIGNPAVKSSFGTPKSDQYLTDTGDQATSFPASIKGAWSSTQSGQFAYISEVQVTSSGFNNTTAAVSIF